MKTESIQSWRELTRIQACGALSLPVILAGYFLGQHYSTTQAVSQIIVGNSILFLLASLYMKLITKYKLTTIEFAVKLMGKQGAFLCAMGMMVSLTGWSVLQMQMLSSVVGHSILIISIATVAILLLGFRQLNEIIKLSKTIMPILLLSLLWAMFGASQHIPIATLREPMPYLAGLMLILTTLSGVVFDLPTFYRFSKSTGDGMMSISLLFLGLIPIIEGVGVFLANHLAQLHYSYNSANPLFLVLICSGVIGITLNLYSACMVANRYFFIPYRLTFLLLTVIIAIFTLFSTIDQYLPVLEKISILSEMMALIVIFNGAITKFDLSNLAKSQQYVLCVIFYLVLGLVALMSLSGLHIISDLFLEVAALIIILMAIYYSLLKLSGVMS